MLDILTVQLTTEAIMAQDKKKSMDEAKKGRTGKEEETKISSSKMPAKGAPATSKSESSSSKKSR